MKQHTAFPPAAQSKLHRAGQRSDAEGLHKGTHIRTRLDGCTAVMLHSDVLLLHLDDTLRADDETNIAQHCTQVLTRGRHC